MYYYNRFYYLVFIIYVHLSKSLSEYYKKNRISIHASLYDKISKNVCVLVCVCLGEDKDRGAREYL